MAVTITTVTWPRDDSARGGPQNPKKGLRGAAGATYVGPIPGTKDGSSIKGPSSPTHATGTFGAGGVEDSTGSRKSDTYNADQNTGGLTGGPSTTVTRQAGGGAGATKTAYLGAGVPGGSTPGNPIDKTGRAADTGTDRFGRSLTGAAYLSGAAAGRYTYTNFDGRPTNDGDGARLAGANRGTSISGETVTKYQDIPVPSTSAAASGVPAVIGAALKIQVDVHTDDLAGGANGRLGVEVALFKRGTDTDEDGPLVGVIRATGTTGATDAFTGLTASTSYVAYVRWLVDRRVRFSGRSKAGFYGFNPATIAKTSRGSVQSARTVVTTS